MGIEPVIEHTWHNIEVECKNFESSQEKDLYVGHKKRNNMTSTYHNSACNELILKIENYFKFAKQWCKSHLSRSIRLEMAEKRKLLLMKKILVLGDFILRERSDH